jgi:integrase
MKLDNATVDKLKLAAGQSELIVFDERLPGFGVRLRAGGKRTWIIQYRVGKQQRRKTLGSVDKIRAPLARETASRDLAAIELGSDPQAQKNEQRARASQTLEILANRFLSEKRKQLKARSVESVEAHLTKHWAPLRGVSVHSITRREVAARLSEIAAERGPYAANRARSTLSGLFAWAMKEGLVDANPVLGTNKPTEEQARDRVLTDVELVAIWNACRGDDYGRIVRLLILTGQRRDEVGAMAKSEITLGQRKWNIPRERTKNGFAHEIHLSDLALNVLTPAIARDERQGRDLLFGDGDHSFSGWSKSKLALDKRIEAATAAEPLPWRLHDLRRTTATRMIDLGILPHVVEAVLNHISGHKAGVAGIYNRALYVPEKRQALDLWGAHVEALLAGEAASNVVSLKAEGAR